MRESLFENMVKSAGDAIVFADKEGVIRVWNRGAEKIFGYSEAETLGESLDIIIPEKMRENHWNGYTRAMESGRTKYEGKLMPTKAIKKDGGSIYVEMSLTIIRDDTETKGALAIMRDITERWLNEKEMKKRLEELESRK